jgi:hypothetical protein
MVFETDVPQDQAYITWTRDGREDMPNHLKSDPLIPQHGGYRELKSYQMVKIVHNAPAAFLDRFINKRSRTHDQMIQAACAANRTSSRSRQVDEG